MFRFPYQTPNFNPYADDEEAQSPVTDAFEASLNNAVDDPRERELEERALALDEEAAHRQKMAGLVHSASQIGFGIAGADPRLIDPRAGEMATNSAAMRAKSARDALERYNQSKAGRVDEAALRAGLAGQDANFRAGREDSAAQRAHQSAALAQDQAQFEAAQRQQRQMARAAQGSGGMTEYQKEQVRLEEERIKAMQRGPASANTPQATVADPAMQLDVATVDQYMSQGGEPPGTGFLERLKDKVLPNAKDPQTIQFQQAAQGITMRLLALRKKGAEPSAGEIQQFMEEAGLMSGDPETVKAGYARVKAQLEAYERMGVQVPGGAQEQDDWQDYEPGQGGGMFR